MANNSRISRKLEKKSKQTMLITSIGIIVILIFFLKFGVPLLINFALLIGGKGSVNTQTASDTNPVYIAAPVLNPTFSATNSAQVTISGVASGHESIDLYLNDDKKDSVDTKSDGSFSFKSVTLQDGENTVKTKARIGKKESDFSESIMITYKNTPVTLSVENPHDGDSFSKDQNSVIVSGKTDPDSRVTVNDFWAIVDDKGTFTYNLHLNNGDNQIKVIATDSAGNKTENDLKVTYSQ